MYIRTHDRLGQMTPFLHEIDYDVYARTNGGIGQAVLQKFGPIAVQGGQPFELTDKQLKDVLSAIQYGHPSGEEIYFFIHRDRLGLQNTYEIGKPHLYPGGKDNAKFNWADSSPEASELTSQAKLTKGGAVPHYVPAGYAHSHLRNRSGPNGIPSGSDLRRLARFKTYTPIVTMVIGEGRIPEPATIDKRIQKGKKLPRERQELDASVIWRSAYSSATPTLNLHFADFASHQVAASAAHRISPDVVFRYFKGKIIYDNGRFSSEFVELL